MTKNPESGLQLNKPKVVFMFVEAGKGHKMPQESLYSAFVKKYGDYCEVVRSNFFSETESKRLGHFEKMLVREVKRYNHNWIYGYVSMYMMEILGPKFLSEIIMGAYMTGVKSAAIRHLTAMEADMVISTHWATNYYAHKTKPKPITVTYVPDVQIIPLFRYPSDLTLVSAERGYKRAMEKFPKRFNEQNLKLVNFAIREEAFKISLDKKQNRRELGLDEDRLTIVSFEGGYGLGKIEKIVKELIKKDLPVNMVAICGTNEKLYKKLSALENTGKVNLIVEGYTDKTLQYLAAADVFMGKGGASSIAEATFYGAAVIITKFATSMERDNAEYYIRDVKNALKIFKPKNVVEKIGEWLKDPTECQRLQKNSMEIHEKFGSERSADEIWAKLCEKFPHLKEAAP